MLITAIATLLWQAGTGTAAPSPEVLKKACEAGGARECYGLADLYEEGRAGLPKDKAKAASLYEKSCSSGFAAACEYVGLMLIKGDGIPKDTRRAVELLKRGCDSGLAKA
jgi:TPR repeat protein